VESEIHSRRSHHHYLVININQRWLITTKTLLLDHSNLLLFLLSCRVTHHHLEPIRRNCRRRPRRGRDWERSLDGQTTITTHHRPFHLPSSLLLPLYFPLLHDSTGRTLCLLESRRTLHPRRASSPKKSSCPDKLEGLPPNPPSPAWQGGQVSDHLPRLQRNLDLVWLLIRSVGPMSEQRGWIKFNNVESCTRGEEVLVLVKLYRRLPAIAPNKVNEQVSVLVKHYHPRHSVPIDEEVSAQAKLSPPRLSIVITPSSKYYNHFVIQADNQISRTCRDPTSQTRITCPRSSYLGRTPFPCQLDRPKAKSTNPLP
jgi:hypothetical protein